MELITGHAGENHISSDDDAAKYAALFGNGNYVLDKGSKFAYAIESNNLITLADGEIIFQGRHARTKPTERENCIIENGTQSQNRHDLIGIRYSNTGGVENAVVEVVKGIPGAIGTDPTYETGDIETGATSVFIPLYRVVLNGLNIERVDRIFNIRYKIPNFLPPGTTEPTANMAPTDDVYVYFQIVNE
jgi:hypothetical protein